MSNLFFNWILKNQTALITITKLQKHLNIPHRGNDDATVRKPVELVVKFTIKGSAVLSKMAR